MENNNFEWSVLLALHAVLLGISICGALYPQIFSKSNKFGTNSSEDNNLKMISGLFHPAISFMPPEEKTIETIKKTRFMFVMFGISQLLMCIMQLILLSR